MEMKNIFQSIRLDHYYYEKFNTNIFKKKFYKAVQDKELSGRLEMSCLSNYNTFNISPGFIWISRFQSYHPFKSCISWSEIFVLVLTLSLVSCLTSSVKNYYMCM